jgi:tRNA pseudouridine38-40 synthase
MRVKAVIAYDGSAFYGFQRQTSTPLTVTQHIESALKSLQIDTKIIGSGRTDRGVHATGQVIHFDLPPYWQDLQKLKMILNRRMQAISLRHLSWVSDTFHARFSAKRRLYRYLFKTEIPSVFEEKYIAHYPEDFDRKRLLEALNCFCGEHDFRYFHKTGSDIHTTRRTIYQTRYYPYRQYHILTFEANGFLRSQVRMMVEASMQCARGIISIETLQAQLACKEQAVTGLAPAEGLYLSKIIY